MKRIVMVAVLFVLMGLVPNGLLAQNASPAAGGTATTSLLAGLGYPDLVVTSDGATSDLPTSIPAGRYHVVLHNSNASAGVELDFFMPPAGTTAADAASFYQQTMSGDAFPEMFYQSTIPGGLFANPGASTEGIIDLTPGSWFAGIQLSNENGPNTGASQALSVTGEMPAVTDPTADVTVTLSDLKVDMPDTLPVGPHIWKVTNAGAMPHFVAVSSSSAPLTQENVQETLSSFIGTPLPAGATPLPDDALTDVADTSVLSPGQTMWIEADLQPGQYLAACYLSGPGDLQMHAAMGMFKIFTVE